MSSKAATRTLPISCKPTLHRVVSANESDGLKTLSQNWSEHNPSAACYAAFMAMTTHPQGARAVGKCG